MKNLFIILLLSNLYNVYSQTGFDGLNNNIQNKKTIIELSKLKSEKFESLSILTIQNEVERKIDFGFIHHRILVITHNDGDFRVDIISENNIIKFGLISVLSWKDEQPEKYKIINHSDSFIKNYLKKHNIFYKSDLKEEDFIEQLNNEYIIGFGCGIVGMDIPKKSELFKKYIKQKNRKRLNNWLRSFSPELQTLGAMGIVELKSISEDELRVMEHLNKRNTSINTCMGCLYGFQETFNNRVQIKSN